MTSDNVCHPLPEDTGAICGVVGMEFTNDP